MDRGLHILKKELIAEHGILPMTLSLKEWNACKTEKQRLELLLSTLVPNEEEGIKDLNE